MSVDDLPRGFSRPTRDEIIDQFQKDYRLRQPGAPVGAGSQAYIDAHVVADALLPVYANAASIAAGANLDDMTLEQLKAEARAIGIPELLPASGGSGFVAIRASVGGVFIPAGWEIKDSRTGLRFKCLVSNTYVDLQPVPIIGTDTGPETNLDADSVLTWTTTIAGLNDTATVLADVNGDGLTGGRFEESIDQLRERIRDARAEPAAAANVAALRKAVKDAGNALGIPIEEAFAFPSIAGPGTIGYCFTLRAARPGGSRTPNSTERTEIQNFVLGVFPEDDGIMPSSILETPITVMLKTAWAPGSVGWSDAAPWPFITDGYEISSAVTPTTTTFRVASPLLGGALAPQIGQTIAFFNSKDGTFLNKRIGTVTLISAGVYDITCVTANNASDLLYVPSIGEAFCPWSDSLQQLVLPMLTAFDALGPGEQVSSFFDAGYRQKRWPQSPIVWPSLLRHKMLDGINDLDVIGDTTWESPVLPYTTAVGSAGVSSNLITLAKLLAFPL